MDTASSFYQTGGASLGGDFYIEARSLRQALLSGDISDVEELLPLGILHDRQLAADVAQSAAYLFRYERSTTKNAERSIIPVFG